MVISPYISFAIEMESLSQGEQVGDPCAPCDCYKTQSSTLPQRAKVKLNY
jgi:hypothetical protein